MAIPVIMPRQGQSVESCIISKWFKQKGDKVAPGDILFSYETDKAAFEEEAQVEGIMLEVFFQEGDDVPVLTNVCVIGQPGEDVGEFTPGGEHQESSQSATAPVAESEQRAIVSDSAAGNMDIKDPVQAVSTNAAIKISPRAKKLAHKAGADERLAVATGPEGRVIERDIQQLIDKGVVATPSALEGYRALDGGQAIAGTGLGGRISTRDLIDNNKGKSPSATVAPQMNYTEVKLTNIRKVIAKAMHQSLSTTAQLTLHASFDATAILAYRKTLKAGQESLGLNNITLNDIVLYAVSRTLLNHKELNAHFLDDKMHLYHNVHLGIAVDTERGLMVPTLFNADSQSLNQMAGEVKNVAKTCQEGSISPDILKGGTFTVTNLGALDIEMFTPVLNPPQTGILGVNTIVYRTKEVNGEFVNYPSMGLSLTFDHRAVDGAPAARFLKELKNNLENFTIMLSK